MSMVSSVEDSKIVLAGLQVAQSRLRIKTESADLTAVQIAQIDLATEVLLQILRELILLREQLSE